ncbi:MULTISPECIES: M4 family metallopeptidase [Myxococcaceae]|uniref:M4 family metallopeptidase n=1 Tax=Myxococcaceae TaxID=31 RepID=UPI001E6063FB|nr:MULTISPECIES: M4 family metallopeptidase [Myxococcaceae]
MRNLRSSILAGAVLALTACGDNSIQVNDNDAVVKEDVGSAEVQSALSALPSAQVVDVGVRGVPTFLRGDLGQADQTIASFGQSNAPARVGTSLQRIAPVFRLRAEDLVVRGVQQDELDFTHLRYQQTKNGLPVVGGELIVHVNKEGTIYAVNGTARDGVSLSATPRIAAEAASVAATRASDEVQGAAASSGRLVYFLKSDTGAMSLAYQVTVTGARADGTPVRDLVYVSAQDGSLLERQPQIHSALNRVVYSANNGSTLPGTLRRSEGGATTGDATIDQNYDHLGTTYNCYSANFGRDSINGAGAQLKSSVHYSTNYVNAYWDGTQMVYGDGDGVQSGPLGRDLDVTVHELTHAVTENESNLTYSGESGALNEGMSDIFAAYCESWTRTWATDADVFKIGEDIWTPGTAGDALRYMANPTQDGSSKDYYPERYTGTSDNGGVHSNSGIANLAFKLLSTGGTHPRAKTTVNVTGIGTQKAGAIFYRANANYMTASTNFQGARNATVQAATDLYGSTVAASVTQAWDAVGVPGGTTPPPPTGSTALSNGVTLTGQSAATGANVYYTLAVPAGATNLSIKISGGTGDADMYVRFGSQPTTTTYDCRPYLTGNAETCTFAAPSAGTYYIMLNAYSAFSGVSIVGSYTAGGGTDTTPVLTNGVPVSNISGATGSSQYWKISVPSGRPSLTVKISGGTGDADLYVRSGAKPTTTTYNCRPYLTGNAETCTISAPAAGDWYIMLNAYSAYSGVTLSGTY